MPLIGFRRNIYFEWLEEVATLVCLGEEAAAIRKKLDASVQRRIASTENRRMAIDILLEVWVKSADAAPALHREAAVLFAQTDSKDDHVALHYGLTLVAYPFFRQAGEVIGQTLRFSEPVRTARLQQRLPAKIGGMGTLHDACKRVTFSLRDWGILVDGERRYEYVLREPGVRPSTRGVACWLLAAALQAHPADSLPFEDLLRLPELFPFDLDMSAHDARQCALLEVHRPGVAGMW